MRRSIPRIRVALAASFLVLAVGCSEEVVEPPVVAAPPPVAKPDPPAKPEKPAPAAEAVSPAAATQGKIQATAASYEPPFPSRSDPFEAPKQARSSVSTGEGDENDSVQLNGFVLVDKPRAILSIDGQIVMLAEGGEKYGVEVVSIDAPRVILQRGGTRWTATLE